MADKIRTEDWLDLPKGARIISRLNTTGFVWLLTIAIAANILFGGVSTGTLGILYALIAVSVIIWIADSLFSKRLTLSFSVLQLPILGLILLGLLQIMPLGSDGLPDGLLATQASTAISLDPYATKLAVLKLILFLIFFSLALTYLDSPKRFRTTVFTVIIFGAAMSFFGILQQLSDPELVLFIREVDYAQPFGTYINRHHFAAFLEMTIALTLGLLFAGSTRPDKRLLLIIAAALMGFGIVFTTSRGALISLIAILLFLTFLSVVSGSKSKSTRQKKVLRSKLLMLVGANVALVLFLLISVAWIGGSDLVLRGTGVYAPKDFSNGRLQFWTNTVEIIKEHPILGTGLESFGVAYTRVDGWNGSIRLEHAHNEYLQMLSDGGIFGFACVVAFIVLLFRRGLKIVRRAENPYRRGIAAGALAGCFGILLHSFFDFPLRTNANMFFFLICATLATADVKFPAIVRRRKQSTADESDLA